MSHFLYLSNYIKRLLILLIIYTISRFCFLYINQANLQFNICDFFEGARFDLSALVYINIPIFILILFPNNLRKNRSYQKITNWIFYLVNIPFILLNNIDIEYYKFTQKRSTIDFLQLLLLSEDTYRIIPQYIKDYWLITLISILQIILLIKFKKIPSIQVKNNFKSIILSIIPFILGTILIVVFARGGLQLKPIKTINAGEICNSQNSALILNTPFCILHSLNEQKLNIYNYHNNSELISIYNPQKIIETNKPIDKKNIIIIILESFSKEFIGYYNTEHIKSHTPFLDSLMTNSLVFNNAYANGLKSIEALPAIITSIPTLMENPFITSKYAQNRIKSLAEILNNEGYHTSFFHGGHRGTMGFYSFCKKAGIKNYFGLEEYKNKEHYDGVWGIYDNHFLEFFAKEINKTKQPFFSTLFTLSSHPPYKLPKEYIKNKYRDISKKINIIETIEYTDNAVKNLFKKIKNEEWYQNSIFIITADHTSPISYNINYKNLIGRYAIPLIIFDPLKKIRGHNNTIVQQIDIMPTVLEIINYNKNYFAFGKSMFNNKGWAINKIENKYHLITNNGILSNKNEEYITFKNWQLSTKINSNKEDIKLLKAIKQSYNQRMIQNKISYEN